MRTIVHYCGRTLDELRFFYTTFTAELIAILEPLLRRIPKLELYVCRYDAEFDSSQLFSLCAELHSITFRRINCSSVIDSNFPAGINIPKLESVLVSHCTGAQNAPFEKFFEMNPQLKEFHLEWCPEVSSAIIRSIAQFTPQIEKLIYKRDVPDAGFEHAGNLKKLTRLKQLEIVNLNESYAPIISEIAAANVPLERFHLTSNRDKDQELFNAISKLNQLKTLRIAGGHFLNTPHLVRMVASLTELKDLRIIAYEILVNDTHYLQIISCAPKLQFFAIESNGAVILDANLYERISKMVARRNGRYRLEIGFQRACIKVPRDLLHTNQGVLKISSYW